MRESNLQWDICMYICVLSLANFTKNGTVRSTWKDDFICCTHVMSVVLKALKMWLVLQENGNTPIVHCCWWYCIVYMKLLHVDTIEGLFFYFNMLIKNTSSNQMNWFWIIVMSLPLSALAMGLPNSSCVRHCNFWLNRYNLVHIQKAVKKLGFAWVDLPCNRGMLVSQVKKT